MTEMGLPPFSLAPFSLFFTRYFFPFLFPQSRRHAFFHHFQTFRFPCHRRGPGDCRPVQRNRGGFLWPRIHAPVGGP